MSVCARARHWASQLHSFTSSKSVFLPGLLSLKTLTFSFLCYISFVFTSHLFIRTILTKITEDFSFLCSDLKMIFRTQSSEVFSSLASDFFMADDNLRALHLNLWWQTPVVQQTRILHDGIVEIPVLFLYFLRKDFVVRCLYSTFSDRKALPQSCFVTFISCLKTSNERYYYHHHQHHHHHHYYHYYFYYCSSKRIQPITKRHVLKWKMWPLTSQSKHQVN